MQISSLVAFCVLTFLSTVTRADDWSQWRGPARDGTSKESGLLKKWPENGPQQLWRSEEVGDGYSTPAVVADRLYIMGNKGPADEFVRAMQASDGKPLWTTQVGKVGPNVPAMNYPGARSTPTVEGDVLYALGSDGDLVCLQLADGAVKWKKNLRSDFGGKPGPWAYSESVLADGEVVVCTPGGADATLVALNRTSGEVVWKCAVPGGDDAAYSSVVAVDVAGGRQYVQFLQKGLVGVDAKTGKFLWRYDQTAKGSPANIPTPVEKDGFIYSATAKGGAGLIKIVNDGKNVRAEQVYFAQKLPAAIGGAVLVGDYLYGTSSQALICLEFKTGRVKWTDRGIGAGSVLYADGMLFLHGENGDVALVEASSEGYRERGSFTPSDAPERGRSKAWAYPVVANGRMYIRDMGVMWCYDVKAQ
jgi:outer membrane protein assembly factor BamB